MKIRFYILTCLLFGGLVSCNDWLDVKPETEMTLEEMYADQQGFQDALLPGAEKFECLWNGTDVWHDRVSGPALGLYG